MEEPVKYKHVIEINANELNSHQENVKKYFEHCDFVGHEMLLSTLEGVKVCTVIKCEPARQFHNPTEPEND